MVYNAQMIRFRSHIYIYKVYFIKGHFCPPLPPLRKGHFCPPCAPPPLSGVPVFRFLNARLSLHNEYNIFYFYNNNLNVNHPKLVASVGMLMSTTIVTAFSIRLESQQHPISPKLTDIKIITRNHEKEVAVIILGKRAKRVRMFHSAGFPDESNVI